MSEPASGRRRPALLAGVVALALAVVAGRLVMDARRALARGDEAAARGDHAEAVRHFLDAGRAYVPGAPYAGRALDRLQTLADARDAAGDPQGARRALEAMRAAILGTRSFYTPSAERLPDVDRRLAGIYARSEDPAVAPGASLATREAWHLDKLSRPPGPHTGWTLAALLGLALWLGAALAFFTRGLDRALRVQPAPALLSAVAFLAGISLFVVGLRLA